MSYTALGAIKVIDTDGISSTELANLLLNIAWFRQRPSFSIYWNVSTAETLAASSYNGVRYNVGATGVDEWYEEWIEPTATAGDLLPARGQTSPGDVITSLVVVGDVEPGIWQVGGYFSFVKAESGTIRRAHLSETDSGRQIVDDTQYGSSARGTAFTLSGPMDFDASTKTYFELEGNHTSATDPLSVQVVPTVPPRWWGAWIAENTSSTVNYATARATSSNNPITWWNKIRINMLRLQSRPAARVRLATTDQTLTTSTFTRVLFNELNYETDTSLVDASEETIDIQERGYYKVSFGVEMVNMTDGTDTIIVDVTKAGAGARLGFRHYGRGSGGDTTVSGNIVLDLDSGDTVAVEAWHDFGSDKDVNASHATNLSVTMLAGHPDDTSSSAQDFVKTGLPAALPAYADMTGGNLPVGHMNMISDVCDFLWAPFVLKRSGKWSDGHANPDGKWTVIPLNTTEYDPHSLTATTSGVDVVTSAGGVKVLTAGLYDLTGYLRFDHLDVEDDAQGADGQRGLRITVNGKPINKKLNRALGASTVDWAGSVSSIRVLAAGDEIEVEAFSHTAEEAEMIINNADLSVIWLGDTTTLSVQ